MKKNLKDDFGLLSSFGYKLIVTVAATSAAAAAADGRTYQGFSVNALKGSAEGEGEALCWGCGVEERKKGGGGQWAHQKLGSGHSLNCGE